MRGLCRRRAEGSPHALGSPPPLGDFGRGAEHNGNLFSHSLEARSPKSKVSVGLRPPGTRGPALASPGCGGCSDARLWPLAAWLQVLPLGPHCPLLSCVSNCPCASLLRTSVTGPSARLNNPNDLFISIPQPLWGTIRPTTLREREERREKAPPPTLQDSALGTPTDRSRKRGKGEDRELDSGGHR